MPAANDVRRCTCADVGIKPTEGREDEARPLVEAIDKYLSAFAAPENVGEGNWLMGAQKCLNCSCRLGGAFGSFRWGIATGEGYCGGCRWPARAMHNPPNEHGEPAFKSHADWILQYHPDYVTMPQEEDAEELVTA